MKEGILKLKTVKTNLQLVRILSDRQFVALEQMEQNEVRVEQRPLALDLLEFLQLATLVIKAGRVLAGSSIAVAQESVLKHC